MGALKPWHIVLSGTCCLTVLAVVAVVALLVMRKR